MTPKSAKSLIELNKWVHLCSLAFQNQSPLKVPQSVAWVHVSLLAYIAKCGLHLSCVEFRASTMRNYFKLRFVSLHNYCPFLTLLRSEQLPSSLLPHHIYYFLFYGPRMTSTKKTPSYRNMLRIIEFYNY